MEIWPAIDLRGGKCVRLRQGDYDRETVFGDRPAETARRWVAEGARRLHLVDLDGARSGRGANWEAVADILAAVDVPCQLGGGVRDEEAIEELLELGLARLVVGTKAIESPDWFRRMCRRRPGRLALAVDARDGRVATCGWLKTSDVSAVSLAQSFAQEPIAAIVYTDIARDGMMAGPNWSAMEEMRRSVQAPLIASGGVVTTDDVRRLAQIGMTGCIIGRALYEGKLALADAIAAAEREQGDRRQANERAPVWRT
jgi:phosphoribosylformimino-5-aminoimidazole carboxamide ribotide isomerase